MKVQVRESSDKKLLIVSAVNLIEGGTLTVLIESLDAATAFLSEDWEIIALVNNVDLIKNSRIRTIAFPKSKHSWIRRVVLEWYHFSNLSRQLKPDLWLSLHDITPRVYAKRQAVYCHNPSPFYKVSLREAILDPKFLLFNIFYKYLYRINIHKNYAVVIQQNWLRIAFRNMYNHSNIIVAHPIQRHLTRQKPVELDLRKTIFLYPSLSRFFKNIEVLCKATACLPDYIQDQIEIRLTIDGSENRYARNLKQAFGNVTALRFIGRQNREQMAIQYSQCDAVLFPSKLETWGLPISEATALGKPLIVSDLPYSHETVGTYANVSFLPPDDATKWADAIKGVALNTWVHQGNFEVEPEYPFANGWPQLWAMLTEGL